MRGGITWRDMTSSRLSEWGNMTPDARMLDLFAYIVFMADEARVIAEIENGLRSYTGVADALTQISTEANALIQLVGDGRATAGDGARYPYTRDPEVSVLLESIRQRLDAMEAILGPERDEALESVEGYAAPYALALFYEINRLDSLIPQLLRDALAAKD